MSPFIRRVKSNFWLVLTRKSLIAVGTPHLNWKKLSTNSPWDFEYVFETMDDYWVGPDENFCPESTKTRWRCNHFFKKWPKSKIKKILLNKNLLLPLTSGVEIFFGCTIFEFWIICCQTIRTLCYREFLAKGADRLVTSNSKLKNGASEKNFDTRSQG